MCIGDRRLKFCSDHKQFKLQMQKLKNIIFLISTKLNKNNWSECMDCLFISEKEKFCMRLHGECENCTLLIIFLSILPLFISAFEPKSEIFHGAVLLFHHCKIFYGLPNNFFHKCSFCLFI